jgi:hypothetical protein
MVSDLIRQITFLETDSSWDIPAHANFLTQTGNHICCCDACFQSEPIGDHCRITGGQLVEADKFCQFRGSPRKFGKVSGHEQGTLFRGCCHEFNLAGETTHARIVQNGSEVRGCDEHALEVFHRCEQFIGHAAFPAEPGVLPFRKEAVGFIDDEDRSFRILEGVA